MKKYSLLLCLLACLLVLCSCEELDPSKLVDVDRVELVGEQVTVVYADGFSQPLGTLGEVSTLYAVDESGKYLFLSAASTSSPADLTFYFGEDVKKSAPDERGIQYEYVSLGTKHYKSFVYALQEFLRQTLTEQTVPAEAPDGDPIVGISTGGFRGMEKLTRVTLPAGITRIESMAFFGCDALTDLYFEGSCAEWGAIEKAVGWNIGFAPGLTIHCTDGDLSLDGE